MRTYGSFSRTFWVVWPIIWYTTLIILYLNQCWRYFLWSWLNFNIKIPKLEVCGSSLPIATEISIFRYQHQCWKILFLFLSKSLCSIMLVYHGWYKLRSKSSFLLTNTLIIGVNMGQGIMQKFVTTGIALYLNIYL